jgi:hypothetical protein
MKLPAASGLDIKRSTLTCFSYWEIEFRFFGYLFSQCALGLDGLGMLTDCIFINIKK